MKVERIIAIAFSALFALGIGTAALAAPSSGTKYLAVLESTPILTPTETITSTATITATPSVTTTAQLTTTLGNKKVPEAISKFFSVPISQVVNLHTQGMGFGEIVIALDLAKASGKTLDEILAMRNAGGGWGGIAKDLNIKPGKWGTNLGQIMSGKASATPPPTVESTPAAGATPSVGGMMNPSMKGNSGAPAGTNAKGNKGGNGKGKK